MYADHHDLHSFPTRRSSDLGSPRDRAPTSGARDLTIGLEVLDCFRQADAGGREVAVENLKTRSEEHTSELQSQFHLVCRLLLEKKKKITLPLTRSHTQRPQR